MPGIVKVEYGNLIYGAEKEILCDLTESPIPARELTSRYRSYYKFLGWNGVGSLATSRGCKNRCKFCSIWKIRNGVFLLSLYYHYAREKTLLKIKATKEIYAPKVSVIIPFKGEDYNFKNTVISLLSQEYEGDYELLFITSNLQSESIDIINELSTKVDNLFLIHTEQDPDSNRSDKINNLLTGVKNISTDSEVLLFIDSDMVAHLMEDLQVNQLVKLNAKGMSYKNVLFEGVMECKIVPFKELQNEETCRDYVNYCLKTDN